MNNLTSWDIEEQQKRSDFMEHLYQVYKPDNHHFTGLWKKFCLEEAGPYCRNEYFERLRFVENFQKEIEMRDFDR
jgi:hypothetical protein